MAQRLRSPAACLTNVIAARARDAREVYSVSIVCFGAEFGRPLMCLMFSESHNITKRFPFRCFVINSAGLTVPLIFSILSSWFFLFLLQPKVLCLHVFYGAAPAAESQPSCCCSVCPDPHVSLVSQFSYRVGQPDGLTRTAYHACCRTLIPRCSVTPLFCVDDQVAKVC